MGQPIVQRAPDRRFARRGISQSRPLADPPLPPIIQRVIRATDNVDAVEVIVAPRLRRTALRLVAHSISTFVTVLALSLGLLAVAPLALGYGAVVVSSGSMQPSLDVADAVVIDPAQDDLAVGTVIDYRVGSESRIHRIVEVTESGYRTKGDANPNADAELVAPGDVHGAGVMVVPFAGVPSWLVATGRWPHLLALVVVLALAGRMSRRRWLDSPAEPSRPGSRRPV